MLIFNFSHFVIPNGNDFVFPFVIYLIKIHYMEYVYEICLSLLRGQIATLRTTVKKVFKALGYSCLDICVSSNQINLRV